MEKLERIFKSTFILFIALQWYLTADGNCMDHPLSSSPSSTFGCIFETLYVLFPLRKTRYRIHIISIMTGRALCL